MPTIVTIGHTDWLVKKDSDAAKIMVALCGAIRLESKYDKGKFTYWPDDGHRSEVTMKNVDARCILRAEPGKEAEADVTVHPARRQIGV